MKERWLRAYFLALGEWYRKPGEDWTGSEAEEWAGARADDSEAYLAKREKARRVAQKEERR